MGNLERHIVLPLLYASADAFVYASETETLGLVVLEAMASGLPVIATPVGGVADHLRDGLNGLAFPAGNIDAMCEAMARIVRDDQLNSRLKLGARKWAEGKSWRAELDRLERSYLDVLEFARSATARDRSPSPYRGGRHHGAARSQIAGST
jgi:glycosyltransferase involved in cell wall biosynthesis